MAYFQLIQDFSLTQEEIALRVGKERVSIAQYLRIFKTPTRNSRRAQEGKLKSLVMPKRFFRSKTRGADASVQRDFGKKIECS